MNELEDIRRFVAEHSPFDVLEPGQLERCVQAMRVTYARAGEVLIDVGGRSRSMRLIRSGAVEVLIGGTELKARLGEGRCFGHPALLRDGVTRSKVVALEDSLLYELDEAEFQRLVTENEAFAVLVSADESRRLRDAMDARRESTTAFRLGVDGSVGDLLRRAAVVSDSNETVQVVARRMAELDLSTMPIVEGGQLVGIVTDRDLRRRVLGGAVPVSDPVRAAMTPDPITVGKEADTSAALMIMADRNVHHLPVVDEAGEILGVLSANDLLSRFSTSALHVVRGVGQAADPHGVARAAARREAALLSLVDAGVDAEHVQNFLSSISEASHRRLAELAEAELGPPPVPYALVVFGSLARREVALVSDQDNGFVFDDSYDAERHGAYFERLARFVVDGLHSAGYPYCPGDIMATNERWARTAGAWADRFRRWIETPDPDALLLTSIFFDMRCVHGSPELVARLRGAVAEMARGRTLFLSYLAREVAVAKVPLGFFRGFVLRPGEEGESAALDLKRDAIASMVAIARVHALACGSLALSSLDRLRAAADAEELNRDDTEELVSAYEFIAAIRMGAQADAIRAGAEASNRLDPRVLSRFDREHLKDAFRVLRRHQELCLRRFSGGIR